METPDKLGRRGDYILPPTHLTKKELDFASKLKMIQVLTVSGSIVGVTFEMGRITILYEDDTSISLLLTVRTYYYFCHLYRNLPDHVKKY
jgi:hypothetical protein